ncbi:reverse transcriptase domain-containing protein [Tanacetum coccineum]
MLQPIPSPCVERVNIPYTQWASRSFFGFLTNNPKDNHVQQPPHKRQNVVRAYTVGANEKKAYAMSLPYCNKCKLHHVGPCTMKYGNSKRIGHITGDCKAPVAATNQRNPVVNQKATVTCYECGRQGHYKSECLKLKN